MFLLVLVCFGEKDSVSLHLRSEASRLCLRALDGYKDLLAIEKRNHMKYGCPAGPHLQICPKHFLFLFVCSFFFFWNTQKLLCQMQRQLSKYTKERLLKTWCTSWSSDVSYTGKKATRAIEDQYFLRQCFEFSWDWVLPEQSVSVCVLSCKNACWRLFQLKHFDIPVEAQGNNVVILQLQQWVLDDTTRTHRQTQWGIFFAFSCISLLYTVHCVTKDNTKLLVNEDKERVGFDIQCSVCISKQNLGGRWLCHNPTRSSPLYCRDDVLVPWSLTFALEQNEPN